MSEREKRYVIVPEYAAQSYLAKGYARSQLSAEQRLGAVWHELPHIDRRDLIVIEIDTEQHEQLSRNPVRFAVKYEADYFTAAIHPKKYEMLEEGSAECMVSNAERDEGAECVPTDDLHLTALEAAVAAIPAVTKAIRLHKDSIEKLEHFLRSYT